MKPEDLSYLEIQKRLAQYTGRGIPESRAFVKWFLEHIYRLDDVTADDAICDGTNDKGVDAIYVDESLGEIHVFQSKLRQNDKATIGDVALKEFAGSLAQFSTVENVQDIMKGNANADLKRLILRTALEERVREGYPVIGKFITNSLPDDNTREYLASHGQISLFDRQAIADSYIDLDAVSGVKGKFSFDASYVLPLQFFPAPGLSVFVLPVLGQELVRLGGISDATLFSENVRLDLGNTKINRGIKDTASKKGEQVNFCLYNNGVTIICKGASIVGDKLEISDYVVVNGAQTINALYNIRSSLTSDLRVLARIIVIPEFAELAVNITTFNNSQNAIKPRDLKSNNPAQVRLEKEFQKYFAGQYVLEIKRGKKYPKETCVISNELAGRLLLAFDVMEPWSAHQIYRVFDDLYAEIFARPEVTAPRIVFLYECMSVVETSISDLSNKSMAAYALTKYFLLYVIALIAQKDERLSSIARDPINLLKDEVMLKAFREKMKVLVSGIVIDLDFEIKERGDFDYKSDLKLPNKVRQLGDNLLRTYLKDVARGKIQAIGTALT